jgi:hypothetical protein
MRRLFATFIACILLAAGTGYASIASNYNHDIATFQSGYLGNNWIWINGGPGRTCAIYKLNGRQVEALVLWAPLGKYFLEAKAQEPVNWTQTLDEDLKIWRGKDKDGNKESTTNTDGPREADNRERSLSPLLEPMGIGLR